MFHVIYITSLSGSSRIKFLHGNSALPCPKLADVGPAWLFGSSNLSGSLAWSLERSKVLRKLQNLPHFPSNPFNVVESCDLIWLRPAIWSKYWSTFTTCTPYWNQLSIQGVQSPWLQAARHFGNLRNTPGISTEDLRQQRNQGFIDTNNELKGPSSHLCPAWLVQASAEMNAP